MILRPILLLPSALYLAAIAVWWAAVLLVVDRWWWLFAVNTVAPYLFLPLPLVALAAATLRSRPLLLGCGAAALLALWLYGPLFLPRGPVARAAGPSLTVMTSNLLAFHDDTPATIAALRAAEVDVIALQEVNGQVAAALAAELADRYPYQLHSGEHGALGMAVISRWPLRATGERLPGPWIGTPQVVEINWQGQPVRLVNLHNVSIRPGAPSLAAEIEGSSRVREAQARRLAAYATQSAAPLIVLGDFNTPELSSTYRILSGPLQDVWRVGGRGLGHTFPGTDLSGSGRPSFAGRTVPRWLTRIDYIFASREWLVEAAWLGPWDERSDHRPVNARLILKGRIRAVP